MLAVLVGLLSLGIYARTLATFVLPGDSGEFQVLVHQLGTAHTTGYATYLILGNLFTRLLPVGDVAWRVNLFSAFMGAVTVGLVYVAGRLLSGSRSAGVFGAFALAAGFTFWSQAIIAEVYTTGAAFLAAVLMLTLMWYQTGKRWPILAAGLLGGVGLGAHGSLAPFGAAVAIFLLLNWRRWREWLMPGAAGTAIGLALYAGGMFWVDFNNAPANIFRAAYSPARSQWGLTAADVANPVARVWFLISAGQWRSAMFTNPLLDTQVRLGEYWANLPRDILLPTLALATFGLVRLIQRDKRLAAFLSVGILLQLIVYLNYNVGDRYVFFIPTYILWVLLAAVGMADLIRIIASQPWGGKPVQAVATVAIAAVCLLPLLWPQWDVIRKGEVAFTRVDDFLVRGDTKAVGKVAQLTTAALPADAIVFADWNWIWPYYYTAHIDQGKLGTQFIETYPRSDRRGIALSTLEFVRENIQQRPIYLADRYREFVDAGYTLHPVQMGATRFWQLESAP